MPTGGLGEFLVGELTDDPAAPAGSVRRVGAAELADMERRAPRWVWAAADRSYPPIVAAGVRLRRGHDVALAERILLGRDGRFDEPVGVTAVLASATGRPCRPTRPRPSRAPSRRCSSPAADADDARPEAELAALRVAVADQRRRVGADAALTMLLATESASGLAAVEIGRTGLPWRADLHEQILTELLGPPVPAQREARGAASPSPGRSTNAFGFPVNPDSAADVRAAFRRVGYDVATTRAWELRKLDHPAVQPLLQYKELARLHAANGRAWLAEWVRDGRFHGEYVPGGVVSGRWASRGGGALQVPRILRRAVVADPGCALVVADAAQLEPRILAAVSGDAGLAALTRSPDVYCLAGRDGRRRRPGQGQARAARRDVRPDDRRGGPAGGRAARAVSRGGRLPGGRRPTRRARRDRPLGPRPGLPAAGTTVAGGGVGHGSRATRRRSRRGRCARPGTVAGSPGTS